MPYMTYIEAAPPAPGAGHTVFFKAIRGSCEKVEVVDIGANNIFSATPALYGVNGTFFDLSTGNLIKMSKMDGKDVRTGGQDNRVKSGTLIIYKRPDSSNLLRTTVQHIKTLGEFTAGTVKMAVGGINLRLSESFTDAKTFHDTLLADDGKDYDHIPHNRHRTALVAFPDQSNVNSEIALVSVFTSAGTSPANPEYIDENQQTGVTAWQLRELIRTVYFPTATGAVMIDGGGSTQMVAQRNGSRKGILTRIKGAVRPVYTMVRTPWSWD